MSNLVKVDSLDKQPRTPKIIVGYRTRVVEGVEAMMPQFFAPSNYKDEDKIRAYVEEKRLAFLAEAANMPYTGMLAEAVLVDPTAERKTTLHAGREDKPDAKSKAPKKPLPVSVRAWLLKQYPNAWTDDIRPWESPTPRIVSDADGTAVVGPSKAPVFIGFDPKTFLKMLGVECSLPKNAQPLPISLWYGNQDHRDIRDLTLPKEFEKMVGWKAVLSARGITTSEGWEPCQDPEEDVRIIAELAGQLGIL